MRNDYGTGDKMKASASGCGRNRILISFCNLGKPMESAVLSYDLDSSKSHWVDPGFGGPVYSCVGLFLNKDFIFSLFSSDKCFHISVIDRKTERPVFFQPLEEIKDGHSICLANDRLFVVSTGTDEVYSYRFTGSGFSGSEVFWRASGSGADTHHLNSVLSVNGEIYVSGFGLKSDTLWRSAADGYIYNISTGVYVKRNIYHPHSVSRYGGSIYYCESSRKSLCSVDGGVLTDKLDGYSRGLCFLDKDTVVVGTSVGRKVSKSEGIILNPGEQGAPAGSSAITVLNLKNGVNAKIDMSVFGHEIYDICFIG